MAQTLARSLRDELAALLAPLAGAGSPEGMRAMLQTFGHGDALAEQASLRTALQQAATAAAALGRLDDAALTGWEGVARVLRAADQTFDAIRGLDRAIADPTLRAQAEGF